MGISAPQPSIAKQPTIPAVSNSNQQGVPMPSAASPQQFTPAEIAATKAIQVRDASLLYQIQSNWVIFALPIVGGVVGNLVSRRITDKKGWIAVSTIVGAVIGLGLGAVGIE